MSDVFIELLNLSIMAGWLILAVMLVRICLKKAPKYIRCILWGLVGLRLICPVSIESVFSLLPSGKVIEPEIVYDRTPSIHSGITVIDRATNTIMAESFTPNISDSVNPLQVVTFVASNLWLLGLLVMLVYCFVSFILIKRKVFDATKLSSNVYECGHISTPFVLGVFRPRIYIPYHMEKEAREYVVTHERAHIKRGDHITKLLGFLILSVYWFNPLVWFAYILLCKDIELACDEKVLKQLGEEKKKNYSKVLLEYSVSPKMIAACPLAFGEIAVKQRIKNALNYKKPTFWIIIISIVLCVAVAICFMTTPKAEKANDEVLTEEVPKADNDSEKDSGNTTAAVKEEEPLLLMVDDVLYYCIGLRPESVAKCGVMDGEIETSVEKGETPTQNNQSNFGTGYGWQRTRHNEIEVYMPYKGEEQWVRFVKEGTVPGETEFDEATILVDEDQIFSITMMDGSTGEEIETSLLMSDNTMWELLELYEGLEFQPLEMGLAEPELRMGWQYCMRLYDVDGNLLQIITPTEDTIEINTPGKNSEMESVIYDSSMNDSSHLLLDYMNLRFHPANGIAGVYTILDSVDSEGFSVSFRNTTDKELQYGEAYTLWIYNNGEWETAPTVVEAWGFNDIAHIISGYGTGGMTTDWTWIYGTLEGGNKYKLTLDLYEPDENGGWEKHTQEYEFFLYE